VDILSHRFADVAVVAPSGSIDHLHAPELERALAPILDDAAGAASGLVVDLAGVPYVSSLGLRVLMVAAKKMRARNGRIAAAALPPTVAEIFEIARFTHVLDVFPTVRDALAATSAPALAAYEASR
jgi:anti-anti-sigma factor